MYWPRIVIALAVIIVGITLFLSWPSLIAISERATGVIEWIPEKSAIEIARKDYENKRDVQSMLAYGRAIDTAMVNMDSTRAALEKEFYRQLAKEEGDSVHIKWVYLYGLWMRESKMDPTQKGDGRLDEAGHIIPGSFRAFGLGQIHVSTARLVDPEATEEKLMDPIYNAHNSAKILRMYTDEMGGNIRYGISAYQQGPKNAISQAKKKTLPLNSPYVMDVIQYAAEASAEENGHTQ